MRTLLVHGLQTFKIQVPDDARITFGPFSPPSAKGHFSESDRRGTLRIYRSHSKEDIIACFSGVDSFRDISLEYQEEVIREEGATIWKSDEHGYLREDKHSANRKWTEPALLDAPKPRRTSRNKPQ